MDLIFGNEDLVLEILLRLPAKSVIRFKSVCKQWLSLVSTDYFRHQHTLRRPKMQQSLILQHSIEGYSFELQGLDFNYFNPTSIDGGEKQMIPYTLSGIDFSHGHTYKIVQSCNGLWLLLCISKRYMYRVYNPTTGQSTLINPTCNGWDQYIGGMALAFDPSRSPYYKLVCIINCPLQQIQVEVYDSESRSWKLSLGPFRPPLRFFYFGMDYCQTRYHNNAIYWWVSDHGTYYRFDIAKNEMKDLSFPQSHRGDEHLYYLQELDGRLYCLGLRVHKVRVSVYELAGDDKWLLKHNRRVRAVKCKDNGVCFELMGDTGSDGSLKLIYYHSTSRKMRAYSFRRRSSRDVASHYSYNGKTSHLKTFQFGQTLALV